MLPLSHQPGARATRTRTTVSHLLSCTSPLKWHSRALQLVGTALHCTALHCTPLTCLTACWHARASASISSTSSMPLPTNSKRDSA